MANTFKNAAADIGISPTEIYICPPDTTAVIFSLYFSNQDEDNPAEVTLEVFDATSATSNIVGKRLPIPIGSTLEFGKIALETGDILRANSVLPGTITSFCNLLEIT